MFLRHRRQVVCDEFYIFIRRSERREIDIPKRCFKALQLIDTIYLIDERKNLAFLPFLKNTIYFVGNLCPKTHKRKKTSKSDGKKPTQKNNTETFSNSNNFF